MSQVIHSDRLHVGGVATFGGANFIRTQANHDTKQRYDDADQVSQPKHTCIDIDCSDCYNGWHITEHTDFHEDLYAACNTHAVDRATESTEANREHRCQSQNFLPSVALASGGSTCFLWQ